MDLLEYNNFYLVGIKGVAMSALAQLLDSAGKNIAGSDVAEKFVTQQLLDNLGVVIDYGFDEPIPENIDCVIYTAAHKSKRNPQVQLAIEQNIPTFSHAEALSLLFNSKKGLAVCGVGGKSTTSAMLAWIFEKTGRDISYAVGVAEIIGLDHVGKWDDTSEYFIAEADEYADNPEAIKNGADIIPRFSYLHPHTTISKQIVWDHPDVYKDAEHTRKTFAKFFSQIDEDGTLILPIAERKKGLSSSAQFIWDYGNDPSATFRCEYNPEASINGTTVGYLHEPVSNTKHRITLQVPGKYNFDNAVSAIIGAYASNIPIKEAVAALESFQSTRRRFENMGTKNMVRYFDDYAHHPMEIENAISALRQWFPKKRKVIVFQPHTYSRTKELFTDFVAALSTADEVVITDIFASAREEKDPTISSDTLVAAIRKHDPDTTVHKAGSITETSVLLKSLLTPGDICLTLGAGDIYKVHKMI